MPSLAKDLALWMERQGWPKSIPALVITTQWQLVDGHHRLAGALAAELEAVPAYVLDHKRFFLHLEESRLGALGVARKMLGFSMPHNQSSPRELQEALKVGQIVRKWTKSRESYVILDAFAAGASDWGAGGCGILALALRELIWDSNLYAIKEVNNPQVQHLVVAWYGVLLDYMGATLPGQKLVDFEHEWHAPDKSMRLVPTEARQDGWCDGATEITCTPAAVDAVVASLRPLLVKVLPELG